MKIKLILLILSLVILLVSISTNIAGSQICLQGRSIVNPSQQEYYSKFIDLKFKNKVQKISGIDFEESITYLGKLKVRNNQTIYVLTSSKLIQAAIEKHGHSKIIFLNQNKETIRQYKVDSLEDLPYKVSRNTLYFHFTNTDLNKIEVYKEKISDDLPDMICVGPDGCFPAEQ